MDVQIRKITPAVARAMLSASRTVNRNLSASVVRAYKTDMKEGRWIENGQTITINESGHIIDGHHRLHALKDLEGVSITVPVIRVQDSHAIETIDVGRNRTVQDLFEMKLGVNGYMANFAIHLTVALYGHNYPGRFTPIARFDTHRATYDQYRIGLDWAFETACGRRPEIGTRARLKNTFRPGAKATSVIWACLGGIYSINKDMALHVMNDLSSSPEEMSSVGRAMVRVMMHHVEKPTDRRHQRWYEERYILGLNHYIRGTGVERLLRRFNSSPVKLALDEIHQYWDTSDA